MGKIGKIALVEDELRKKPRRWLVTGAAGFIGSHIIETLLALGQDVTGLDNLSTGSLANLADVEKRVGPAAWKKFTWQEGDICDVKACERAASGAEFVLHQAALGSVPRSIEDPVGTNEANVVGFIKLLRACASAGVKRFVYASSSSVYGDIADNVKTEERLGNPLSPYAASKRSDEIYAQSFSSAYGISCVGIRYFNVFGPRQNPEGPYAAVVPRWVEAILTGRPCQIFGDGETTRDFCYVANAVQMNLLAALYDGEIRHEVFNAAVGKSTSLVTLHSLLADEIHAAFGTPRAPAPEFQPFRAGDVRNSLADIKKGSAKLGYEPRFTLEEGLRELVGYLKSVSQRSAT